MNNTLTAYHNMGGFYIAMKGGEIMCRKLFN